MIVVAVRDGDRIQLLAIRQRKEGQRGAAIAFGVHSRIHQESAIIHFDQPRAGANIRIRVQICYMHFESITKVGENGPKTETFSLKSPLFFAGTPGIPTSIPCFDPYSLQKFSEKRFEQSQK